MDRLIYPLIWISRINHCRGFGIQSPTDYWLVRYVINEHWPYYWYGEKTEDDWLTQKLGRLYFRLANWRQPEIVRSDGFYDYFHAGCLHANILPVLPIGSEKVDLVRLSITECRDVLSTLYSNVDKHSVLIIENIKSDSQTWNKIVEDKRTCVTFDLYYCGIVLFNGERTKRNYIINF